MEKNLYAHSLEGRSVKEWQPLAVHSENVAAMAEKFAKGFSSGNWAWNAGLLHDIGKAAVEFQAYLARQNGLDDENYDNVGHRHINHSSAGAAFAVQKFNEFVGLTLAFLAAGHHAGLPDWFETDSGNAALRIRIEEGQKNLDAIRTKAEEISKNLRTLTKPPDFVKPANFHLWVRMLFSALVDADYLDTEAFMQPGQAKKRKGFSTLIQLKNVFDRYMETFKPNTPVNQIRSQVLSECRRAAAKPSGLFSLTVPTGGGKTLSAMAFALDHAQIHNKNRIIYVIPFTSIVEQTSETLANIFGVDNVVEHHSNLEPDRETQRSRLASENWDAPIVVTTNVQLFESLFGAKSRHTRKLHHIVNSVIILDEAQLIPPKWLVPCVDVMNQLTRDYGVTIVLATATQPALEHLDQTTEIIPDPSILYQQLKRTQINMPSDFNQPCTWEKMATELQTHRQVLCVVNTRRDCYELFSLMPDGAVHLSALMCGQHRSQVIQQIKKKLNDGLPICVISTQLVEAGVDIDFPVVYRALAGLDSIIQTGGRCNREGKLKKEGKLGVVNVFVPPKPTPRGLLRKGEDTTREMYASLDLDLNSPKVVTSYFRSFYSRVNDTGATWLKNRLIKNVPFVHFRTAAKEFKFIDDQTQQSVFVQFQESGRWLDELRRIGPTHENMRRLQRYVVNLSKSDFLNAKANGLLEEIWKGLWLWIGPYDSTKGLSLFHASWAPEDLLI
jgi:CRISPR-associated endonuclease/helicase Cas3